MTLETWVLFCATETVLCFTPGPAVLLVVSTALTRSSRAGIAASFGILAANAAYFALSATSLGAILLASWELFSIVKWIGAAYLVYIGCSMLVSSLRRRDEPAASTVAVEPQGRLGSFGQGLITQGSNPKLLVFFSAILPQFIDTAEPLAWQVAILGVSSIVIEFVVLYLYVRGCDRARTWVGSPLAVPLQAVGGILLVVAGLRLAALRRG